MGNREALREQLETAFEGAEYPVHSPGDLAPALPDGPATRFEAGDFSVTATELTTRYRAFSFPAESAEALAAAVVESLAEQDAI